MIFILMATITLVGIGIVGILLFNERKSGGAVLGKYRAEQKLAQELAEENKTLKTHAIKSDNEILRLTEILKVKTESVPIESKGNAREQIANLIDQTKLKDIMATEVISINARDRFSEVARKMKEFSIRHLPVVDDQNRLVGMITQRMLYQIKSPRKLVDGEWYYDAEMLNDVILEHVMQKDIFSLQFDLSMGQALLKMVHNKYGSIPIVDDQRKLIGLITRNDVLKVAAQIYESQHKYNV